MGYYGNILGLFIGGIYKIITLIQIQTLVFLLFLSFVPTYLIILMDIYWIIFGNVFVVNMEMEMVIYVYFM